MRFNKTILIFLCILTAYGCKKSENRKCFKSIGSVITEERELAEFSAVVLENHIDLELTEDTTNFIVIESGENLIKFITTSIVNDTLFIRDDNTCGFLRDLGYKSLVKLSSSNLRHLISRGSGDVSCVDSITRNMTLDGFHANGEIDLTFNCDSLSIIINVGVTKLRLSGTITRGYFYYFGNGNIDASELSCNKVLLNWQSTGWLKTNVANSLVGEIGASGNVFYTGSPSTINVSLSGSGNLIAE